MPGKQVMHWQDLHISPDFSLDRNFLLNYGWICAVVNQFACLDMKIVYLLHAYSV